MTPNPFDNDTGLDIIRVHSSVTNFVFVDAVPGDRKPRIDTSTPNDPFGIQVEGGTGGHLKIEAGPDDELIRIIESTSSSATVEARSDYTTTFIGNSRFGAGVNKLTIQTDGGVTGDVGNAVVRVTTAEPGGGSPPFFGNLPGLHPNTLLRIDSRGINDEVHLGGAPNASVHAEVHTGKGADKVFLLQNKNTSAQTTTAIVDFDPTLGGGLGSGHSLQVGTSIGGVHTGLNCRATLKQLGTTAHDIVVDRVQVANDFFAAPGVVLFPGTVVVSERTRMGELVVPRDNAPTFDDPLVSVEAPLDVEKSSAGAGTSGIALIEGRMIFKEPVEPSVVYESNVYEFDVEGNDVRSSTGVVEIESRTHVTMLKPTTLNAPSAEIGTLKFPGTTNTGKLTLEARPSSGEATRVLRLATLDMGSGVGQLDLTNNAMIVDYTGSTPIATIQSLLTSGYNASATPAFWTGNGIRSSNAAADAINPNALKTGLGYVEATDLFTNFNAEWEQQQSVDATCVLVRYTYYGDVNLDEIVNLADFNRLAAFFGQSGMRWNNGDFNYDGNVNLQDFNRQAANFGQSGGLSPLGGYTYEDLLQILMEMYPEYF